MKITVVGLGYVGLANAIFLSHHHDVLGIDTDQIKIDKINQAISPIEDQSIVEYFNNESIKFKVTTDYEMAYQRSDVIIIALPTNFDEQTQSLDLSLIDATINEILARNNRCEIVIRSTLPIGTCDQLRKKFNYQRITFIPEFLREGTALSDTINPTRVIIGTLEEHGQLLGKLFTTSIDNDAPLVYTTSDEAEAIKLFSNAYLAMRVAFFNEVDSMALFKHLNSSRIIKALGLDPRIGSSYNNPSFGYSGYCLPKDVKQVNQDFANVAHPLHAAIEVSNQQRIKLIVDDILASNPKVVGIYRLTMKAGSSSLRHAIIHNIINAMKNAGKSIIIFEPLITNPQNDFEYVTSIDELINKSDIIIANRIDEQIMIAGPKLYTRDVFKTDQ